MSVPVPDHDDTDTPTLSMRPDALFADIRETPAPTLTPAPIEKPQPAADPKFVACPRCGSKLINPESIGWCPACGYCRSIEEGKFALPGLPSQHGKPSALGALEFLQLRNYVPAWLRVLAYGTLAFCIVSALAHIGLARYPFAKAVWSLVQLILGLIAIFAAQVWALIVIAPQEERLGNRDLFIPGRLWGHIFRRLPQMHRQVWLGCWGAIASLCALGLIGGLEYWLQFYHPRKFADLELVSSPGSPAGLTKETVNDGVDRRPLAKCIIIGFITDSDDHISSLVLAVKDGAKFVYVGQVKNGITEEVNRELLPRLRSNIVDQPAVRGLIIKQATWVAPLIFCEVHQDGYDELKHLRSPSFAGILDGFQ
jgi:hypothetical protein